MALLDRLTMSAARAYTRFAMASPVNRTDTTQFVMTVSAVTDLGGGMRRITFTAPEFATFARVGADEYFGLLMPPADRPFTLPDDRRLPLGRRHLQR